MWKRPKKAKDPLSIEEAYAYSLRLLQVRWQSKEELRKRLREKEFAAHVVVQVLAKLQEINYIDDSRLVQGIVRDYKDMRFYGPAYIKQRLLQRQFSRQQIDAAIKRLYGNGEELKIARLYFAKQKQTSLEDPKAKQRLMQKFLRRGFSPGVVFQVFGESLIE